MTKRRFIEIATSITVMAVLSIGCVVYASGEKEQSITDSNVAEVTEETETRYVYPMTPENEEWAEFSSHHEMVQACLVPEEVMEKMSTKQLVDAFLDYPLLVDFTMYTNYSQGYDCLYSNCNVLQTLMEREDCIEELLIAYENMDSEDVEKFLEASVLKWMLTREEVVEQMNKNQLERMEELKGETSDIPWLSDVSEKE